MWNNPKLHDALNYVAFFLVLIPILHVLNFKGLSNITPPFIQIIFWMTGAIAILYIWWSLNDKLPISKDLIGVRIHKFTSSGFEILDLFTNTTVVKWADVDNVYYTTNRNGIIIEFKKGHAFQIYRLNKGWYQLGLEVPGYFTNFDHNFVKNILMTAQPCPVCGHISLVADICAYCHYSEWDSEFHKEEFGNRNKYIYQIQLEHFATFEEGDSVDFYPKEQEVFKFNREWKPMVSEDEVLKYSQLNTWEAD
jgi:hypothetical protein